MRWVLALALVLLAGCTTTVAGTPRAVPTPTPVAPVRHVDPAHVTAADALGDITTLDACSLVEPTSLPGKYGDVEEIPAENIDDCEFYAPSPHGTALVVYVGQLEDYTTASYGGVERFLDRSGGMRIALLADDDRGCDALLVFADNMTMAASAFPATEDTVKGGACDLVTAVLDQVIGTATGDGPRHRSYQANSLAHQDACLLLTADDARLAQGTVHRVADFPSHHRCIYGGNAARVQIELNFAVYDEMASDDGWTTEVIAGRSSLVEPDQHPKNGTNTYCVVVTKHVAIDSPGSDHFVEDAELLVRVPSTKPVPCDEAKAVAAAVWPKLPRA